MLTGLIPKIFGFLVIVVTLAMAPSINTANAVIVADNLTNLIGMSVLAGFGAPLIIIGLLVSGGFFAVAGIRGQMQGASMRDMFNVIGSVVIAIVALTFMDTIIDYVNALIGATTGFALVLYGIIPLVTYLGIIAGVAWTSVSAYRSGKGKGRGSRKGAHRAYGY